MNEENLADLKQFIVATIIQYTSDLVTKKDLNREIGRLEKKIDQVDKKVDHIVDAIDKTVIPYISIVDDQVQEHEKILKKLRAKVA